MLRQAAEERRRIAAYDLNEMTSTPFHPVTPFLRMASPERFEAVIQSISDGVFTVDRHWRITCFNRAAEKITGVPRSEAMGRKCHEVLDANICRSACPIQYTIETGRPVVDLTATFTSRNGKQIPVSVSTALFKDNEGELIGGVETFRDLRRVEALRKTIKKSYSFEDIISKNKKIREILDVLPTVAINESSVLITGETGTGKELFARALHNLSGRSGKAFIAVNCGGFPETLIESELFGYEAGAFTGAVRAKPGRFQLAEGGTLFLDEIGELPYPLQVKLLRVLQEKTYEPLGSIHPRKADVRIIAASNRNLEGMVAEGTFRQDLFYRVNVIKLQIPPLRDRMEDVPLLVDHFIKHFSALHNKDVVGISPRAMRLLMSHDYPGNIRELDNIIEHGCVLCQAGFIRTENLPDWIRQPTENPDPDGSLKEVERQFLLSVLKKNEWNRLATAHHLKIHKTTLFRKIKKLGIELPEQDGRSSRNSRSRISASE